ncbi:hypothetical protein AB0442_30470 [Kitasatospora sp. NPDC085895]|uniref:hypothetical protein n=1 Tax=Kitasatospora sp. NPDC085895 TaxID=3155057 RepID=UPI00344BFA2B
MRAKGINYDTGFTPDGRSSRPHFDPAEVRAEMRSIAEDLHCTAVRITGADLERIALAAEHAAAHGLEVWFAPFPCGLDERAMRPVLLDCARRAERLRAAGAEVLLVLGCELTLFADGFLPGADLGERIAALLHPGTRQAVPAATARLDAFLADTAAVCRAAFGGRITYASGVWERIDWTPFDLVAVDAYRDAHNAARYRDELRAHSAHGKPVAVTEFGCCTYAGAGDRGGLGWDVIDRTAQPPAVRAGLVRDEQEQVRYLQELLPVFEEEGVDAAFWFTWAGYRAPHRPDDPAHDLDLGSYGAVALEDGVRRPKAVFTALAEAYRA